MNPEDLIHGRPSTYNNHRCRCEDCTTAWADYIREKGYVRRWQQKVSAKNKAEKAAQKGEILET